MKREWERFKPILDGIVNEDCVTLCKGLLSSLNIGKQSNLGVYYILNF